MYKILDHEPTETSYGMNLYMEIMEVYIMKKKILLKRVQGIVLAACFLLLLSLAGCGQTQDRSENGVAESDQNLASAMAASGTAVEQQDMNQKSSYVADITHDGIDDILELKMDQVENPESDEEQTVLLKSGATGKTVWGLPVNTVHAGWKGVYLYEENNKTYLMVFSPAMYQGMAVYEYKIFYVDEAGKEIVLHSNLFEFDLNHPKETDPASLRSFAEEVNQYLHTADLIISTLEGELKTAADYKEEPILTYDPSETLQEIETALGK